MRRMWWILIVLVPALAWAAWTPDGGVDRSTFDRFADMGTAQDFSPERGVYFPTGDENYWLWGMRDASTFIHYENEDRFYWVTKPRHPEDFTTARTLKSNYSAKVKILPLDAPAKNAMLAIRFKDNLLQPTTIELRTTKNWVKLGQIGGAYDHKWKTGVLTLDTTEALAYDGGITVRIGRGDYGDLRGDLPIDWIGLAKQKVAVPGPTPGFWPKKELSRFARLAQTMEYAPGDGPKLLTGLLVKGMREGTWKRYQDSHVNAVIFQGWETVWKRKWERYSSGNYQDRIRFGLPDFLEACAKHDLLCTSQFFTDTRSYWIKRQYGSEEAVLDELSQVMKFNREAAGNLGWYLKDEADHNDDTWGSPPEFVLQLYNLAKKADPARPTIVLFQGWKPGSFAMYDNAFDVAAFDVYPVGSGRKATEISDRIERMRQETAPGKALWAVIEAHEGQHVQKLGRQLTAPETLVQGYLCLAHDVQGVFYYVGNESTYIDFEDMPGPAAGMKQFFKEVNGPGGIASFFLPGAVTVTRTDGPSSGIRLTKVNSDAIHFIYKRKATGENMFVAVNTRNVEKSNVKIQITGLLPTRTLKVMFEDRTIQPDNAGAFKDTFGPYERHVYTW
jgi:hypothetical protein